MRKHHGKVRKDNAFKGFMRLPMQADSDAEMFAGLKETGDWYTKKAQIIKKPRKFKIKIVAKTECGETLYNNFETGKIGMKELPSLLTKHCNEIVIKRDDELEKRTQRVCDKQADTSIKLGMHSWLNDILSKDLVILKDTVFAYIYA